LKDTPRDGGKSNNFFNFLGKYLWVHGWKDRDQLSRLPLSRPVKSTMKLGWALTQIPTLSPSRGGQKPFNAHALYLGEVSYKICLWPENGQFNQERNLNKIFCNFKAGLTHWFPRLR